MFDVNALDFTKGNGLVSVIAQDATSGAILMVAFADREAIERTVSSGELHLFSRTRGAWHKGATSGNTMRVRALTADCDGDAVRALVEPAGPACHTGAVTCFGDAQGDALSALDATIAERMRADAPTGTGYTQRLLGDRNLRLKKIGEEASELVTACADADTARATEEAADLIYHTLVALRAAGGSLDGVREVLAARAR
jgi:phosphoribosyl-AMP cyclohydrolase / phosphoribosyl-ATP pyrophosphohydrolase